MWNLSKVRLLALRPGIQQPSKQLQENSLVLSCFCRCRPKGGLRAVALIVACCGSALACLRTDCLDSYWYRLPARRAAIVADVGRPSAHCAGKPKQMRAVFCQLHERNWGGGLPTNSRPGIFPEALNLIGMQLQGTPTKQGPSL